MAITAIFAPFIPLGLALLPLGWWSVVFPRIAIGILGISLITGQVLRIPVFGQAGGLLLSDVAVILILVASSMRVLQRKQISRTATYHGLLLLPFLMWSLFTLVIHLPSMDTSVSIISISYLFRLTSYLLLLPALLLLFQDPLLRRFAHKILMGATVALLVLGFLQILILPNIHDLPAWVGTGWDPHEKRLVASWLDPNFLGGFFMLMLIFWGANARWTIQRAFLIGASFLALALTQSRSSLIALAAAGLLMSPLLVWRYVSAAGAIYRKHRILQIVLVGALGLVSVSIAGWILGDRLVGTITHDSTVQLRLQSLRAVWQEFASTTALVGVGYNSYQFAAARAGLASDFSLHSRAGVDNSWLMLWVTTGIPGVILFLLPWTYGLQQTWRRFLSERALPLLAPLGCFLTLLIHSQFLNSFLYVHLLITLSILWALSLSTDTAS
ncbi:MAG: O-antigen ligase family protein [Candidatus Andersenbacteria bacterium]|nr:O-antigen ligase family protein [Candidatus Andersenbacteria bacterium]MBI3250753.1 O-antigen ligase family protein [Candidatus Andersenbacteria bacterium]